MTDYSSIPRVFIEVLSEISENFFAAAGLWSVVIAYRVYDQLKHYVHQEQNSSSGYGSQSGKTSISYHQESSIQDMVPSTHEKKEYLSPMFQDDVYKASFEETFNDGKDSDDSEFDDTLRNESDEDTYKEEQIQPTTPQDSLNQSLTTPLEQEKLLKTPCEEKFELSPSNYRETILTKAKYLFVANGAPLMVALIFIGIVSPFLYLLDDKHDGALYKFIYECTEVLTDTLHSVFYVLIEISCSILRFRIYLLCKNKICKRQTYMVTSEKDKQKKSAIQFFVSRQLLYIVPFFISCTAFIIVRLCLLGNFIKNQITNPTEKDMYNEMYLLYLQLVYRFLLPLRGLSDAIIYCYLSPWFSNNVTLANAISCCCCCLKPFYKKKSRFL